MPGAVGAAVQVPILRGRRLAGSARGTVGGVDAGCQRPEDRVEMGDHLRFAPDHQAEAAFEAEHPAAGADIDVVDLSVSKFGGAVDVVAVVAVATVDDDVARIEVLDHVVDDRAGQTSGHHHPDRAGRDEQGGEFLEGRGAGCAFGDELGDRFGVDVVDHAVVTLVHGATHEVGPHTSQSDHC